MGYDNLDLRCAQEAGKLARRAGDDSQLEKLCIDATAVLSASGPYALFLYLRSREDPKKNPDTAGVMIEVCFSALADWFPALKLQRIPERVQILEKIGALSEDLDGLLMAKRFLSRILMYARYHAKAAAQEKKSRSGLSVAAGQR